MAQNPSLEIPGLNQCMENILKSLKNLSTFNILNNMTKVWRIVDL
jgi:hypothetical protein